MDYSDDPVADQASNDKSRVRQTHTLEAYLDLTDVLYVKGPIAVDGYELDAVVNVTVVQRGDNRLDIEYFEVMDDMVDILDQDGIILYASYSGSDKTHLYVLMENFRAAIEKLAMDIAKNTDEQFWNYRLIE